MKLIQKWLFPVLTCFLVIGAAVLPQYVSQTRDAQQFGQVHAEALDAAPLPVYEPPSLMDRIKLYAGRYNPERPILFSHSYSDEPAKREIAQSVQDLLIGAGVLPEWIFREEPFEHTELSRCLLWDPDGDTLQKPIAFWEISLSYFSNKSHLKSLYVTVDTETGLPIKLHVGDTNMSQWLPYQTDDLRTLARHFFELLEMEAQEIDLQGSGYASPSLNLSYAIAGTGMNYFVSRAPVDLEIQMDDNWWSRTDADSSSIAYDR